MNDAYAVPVARMPWLRECCGCATNKIFSDMAMFQSVFLTLCIFGLCKGIMSSSISKIYKNLLHKYPYGVQAVQTGKFIVF